MKKKTQRNSLLSETSPRNTRRYRQPPNLQKVSLFYKLRQKILIPFLIRDIVQNRREQFVMASTTKDITKSKKATNRKKAEAVVKLPTTKNNPKSKKAANKKKAIEVSEDEVSHGEEWSGWDNDEN